MVGSRGDPAASACCPGTGWYATEEDDESVPTELNTASHPRYLVANKDKLTIRYVGKGNHTQDVGAIRANRPCPHRRLLYYFEITVLDGGSRGCIAVGLAGGSFELHRQPGWEPNSYAYHGEDGRKYSENERGEAYGPSFSAGDVVGCGLLLSRREIFFTINGRSLGAAFSRVGRDLYPTVGLHSPGETVSFNFGAAPFAFDVGSVLEEERRAKLAQVMGYTVPAPAMGALVRSYLLHYSYEHTLAALDASNAGGGGDGGGGKREAEAHGGGGSGGGGGGGGSGGGGGGGAAAEDAMEVSEGEGAGGHACGNGASSNGGGGAANGAAASLERSVREEGAREAWLARTLRQRLRLRELLLAGDVRGASDECERAFPGLLAGDAGLRILLRCQTFLELVRERKPLEAVGYAQRELAPYRELAEAAHPGLLNDVVGLIAYDDPTAPSVPQARLMARAQREAVADALNGAVLREQGLDPACALERLLRQLVATHVALRDANHGCGEGFRLLGE